MIYKVFLKMEEECNLFDFDIKNKIPLWDILRMHIYLKYHFPDLKDDNNKVENSFEFKSIIAFFSSFFKSIYNFFNNKSANFILPCSRYIDDDGLYFDKAAMSIIENLVDDVFIFEYKSLNKEYKYKLINNYVVILKKIFRHQKKIPKKYFFKIKYALVEYFGECKIDYEELNNIYNDYLFELRYYKFILSLKKFKRIFITQNGLQKGLIAAAKHLNIETYELQHGSFEVDHLAYSYPNSINYNSNIILQDYVITFSKYWGNYFNVPVKKMIPLGNDYFFNKPKLDSEDNSILIISSIIHGEVLSDLAIKLSLDFPDRIIKFKLHSNEYGRIDIYTKKISHIKNIKIIKNELEISQLIALSSLVILINSTVLYEALNQSKKVAIFKQVNYLGQQNVFNLPNVFVFEYVSEIRSILKIKNIEQESIFFNPFNKKKFKLMLNS